MFRQYYNLGLMAFWLAIAVLLLAPEDLIAPRIARQLGGPLKFPVGVLALALAAYNAVRWWVFRKFYRDLRATPVRPNALSVRKVEDGYEHIPELDFFKAPDDEPPKPPAPSANGDAKKSSD